jgi:peptidoglycan-associated lipoprotein
MNIHIKEEHEMAKRIVAILGLMALMLVLIGSGCGKKDTVEPTIPKTEGTEKTEQPTEPTTPTEPKVERLTEDQFKIAYFDYDKYNLRPDAREALEFNARLLKENPDAKVLIEGHCDERGTVEYNLALGDRRARSAKDYLSSLGIDAARMQMISYGKERPVALGHEEDSWQKNRRAKFTMTSE